MADSAPVMIWLTDKHRRYCWFNKVWLDFTGQTIEHELGSGWINGIHPDNLDVFQENYQYHFERQLAFSMEFRLKRHDGEYRWLLDTGIPRYDDRGEFVGYIGSCIDITERRQTQIDLEHSNADLSRFAEISAHHLMEPTRRFGSFTQRLRTSLSAYPDISNNADIAASLSYLEQDAQRLRSLVRDIQRYIAADQARDKISIVDANTAVESALQHFADKIAASGAIISVSQLPNAYIDLPRLIELFSLFLENALLHARPVDPQQHLRIEIDGMAQQNVSRYSVRDNGAGISAEYRQRVFEIFERLNYADSGPGTGIGLSIARRIVASCRGNIWIESSDLNGTTLVFELPNIESNSV
jgi:PAS domain S-box-containing protein